MAGSRRGAPSPARPGVGPVLQAIMVMGAGFVLVGLVLTVLPGGLASIQLRPDSSTTDDGPSPTATVGRGGGLTPPVAPAVPSSSATEVVTPSTAPSSAEPTAPDTPADEPAPTPADPPPATASTEPVAPPPVESPTSEPTVESPTPTATPTPTTTSPEPTVTTPGRAPTTPPGRGGHPGQGQGRGAAG